METPKHKPVESGAWVGYLANEKVTTHTLSSMGVMMELSLSLIGAVQD
jgi:hypothetical protein